MSSKLFVGGLSFSTTDAGLRAAFEPHGEVVEARVVLDRATGRSRGFGFVSYRRPEEARLAVERMSGAVLDGRVIRVDLAEDRRGPGGGSPRGDRPPRSDAPGYGGPRREGWGGAQAREGAGYGGPRREGWGGERPGGFQRPAGERPGGPAGRPPGGGAGFQRSGGPGGFGGGAVRPPRPRDVGWSQPPPDEGGWDDARIRRSEPKKAKTRSLDLEPERKVPKVTERPKRLSGKSWRQWESDDDFDEE